MNEAEYLMKMSITRNIIQSESHRSEKKITITKLISLLIPTLLVVTLGTLHKS